MINHIPKDKVDQEIMINHIPKDTVNQEIMINHIPKDNSQSQPDHGQHCPWWPLQQAPQLASGLPPWLELWLSPCWPPWSLQDVLRPATVEAWLEL